MGQATRTTKLLLDLGQRSQGGANTGKRAFLAGPSPSSLLRAPFTSTFF